MAHISLTRMGNLVWRFSCCLSLKYYWDSLHMMSVPERRSDSLVSCTFLSVCSCLVRIHQCFVSLAILFHTHSDDISLALSVWQIHKGFSIWEWSPPSAASYIIYAWAGICVFAYCIGMFFIPHQIRKTHSCEISAKQGQRGAGGDD